MAATVAAAAAGEEAKEGDRKCKAKEVVDDKMGEKEEEEENVIPEVAVTTDEQRIVDYHSAEESHKSRSPHSHRLVSRFVRGRGLSRRTLLVVVFIFFVLNGLYYDTRNVQGFISLASINDKIYASSSSSLNSKIVSSSQKQVGVVEKRSNTTIIMEETKHNHNLSDSDNFDNDFDLSLSQYDQQQQHYQHINSLFEILLFLSFAVLCGLQPILVKWFMPTTVRRNVVILCQEMVKLVISLLMLFISSSWYIAILNWTFTGAMWAAGVPSLMFVIQNHCNLFANQQLQPVTFVVLNQTKIVWTALCCYLLLGQGQSKLQIIALLLIVLATLWLRKILPLCSFSACSYQQKQNEADDCASERSNKINNIDEDSTPNKNCEEDCKLKLSLLTSLTNVNLSKITDNNKMSAHDDDDDMEDEDNENETKKIGLKSNTCNNDNDDDDDSKNHNKTEHLIMLGVTTAMFASFLSGMSASITQLTLQVNGRNPHLFNVELSVVSSAFLILSIMGESVFSSSSSSLSNHRTNQKNGSITSSSNTSTKSLTNNSFNKNNGEGGLFMGFTWQLWIPIITQALGGILVGLVTKHLGAITKGFGNIFGIAISSILQQLLMRDQHGHGGLSSEEIVGAGLSVISLYLHVMNPLTS